MRKIRYTIMAVLLALGCASLAVAELNTFMVIEANVDRVAVTVDGTNVGFAPVKVPVKVGHTYTIRGYKEGYAIAETTYFPARSGYTGTVRINMTRYGNISVQVSNVSGASVYLNGSYRGTAPLTINNLNPGTYKVRVSKANLPDEERNVYVSAGNTASVSFTMRTTGNISVKVTNVSGARIYLNGVYKGIAPLTINNLNPGTYTVRASKGNYPDEDRSVRVTAGTTSAVDLTMKTADLTVNTPNVSGVEVYLNGSLKGSTPLTLHDLEPGSYTVQLKKQHYAPETLTTTLVANYVRTITQSMTKISGYLTVRTTPSSAQVSVGGTRVSGTTELDEGTYTVTVRCFGYTDDRQRVTIVRNETKSLSVQLNEAPFAINSLSLDDDTVTPQKKSGSLKVAERVTAPETGTVTVTDAQGAVVTSWRTRFTTWNQYTEWDGTVDGAAVPDGTYTVSLSAGGYERSAPFTVKSGAKSLSDRLRGAKPLAIAEASDDGDDGEPAQKKTKATKSPAAKASKAVADGGTTEPKERTPVEPSGRRGVYLEVGANADGIFPAAALLFDVNDYFSIGGDVTFAWMDDIPMYPRDGDIGTSHDDTGYHHYFDRNPEGDVKIVTADARVEAGIPLGHFYPYAFGGVGIGLARARDASAMTLALEGGAGIDWRPGRNQHFALGLFAKGAVYTGVGTMFGAGLTLGWHF